MRPVKPIRIAIAGGCINTGFGIVPLNSVYHRIFVKNIEQSLQLKLRLNFANLECNDPLTHIQRTQELLLSEKKRPDALIYQIRPSWVWLLCSSIWKIHLKEGLCSIRLNSLKQESNNTWRILSEDMRGTGKLQKINHFLSTHTGQIQQGRKALLDSISTIHQSCQHHGDIPFYVLSPIFGPWFSTEFANDTVTHLEIWAKEKGIHYIDCSELSQPSASQYWSKDQIHCNTTAHQKIADIITTAMTPWLQSYSPHDENHSM